MYSIGGQKIKAPQQMKEGRVEQYAQQKALDGSVNRDYFSSREGTKRIWTLTYYNILPAAYNVIDAVYTIYKLTDTTQAFVVSDLSISTDVHMDLVDRDFSVSGNDYLSSFTLVLTEA